MAENVKIQVQFQRVGKKSIAKAKRDLKELRGSSEKAGSSMKQSGKKMQSSMKKIQKNTKGTSEGMQNLRNDVKGLGKRMNEWGKKMQGNMKKSSQSSKKMAKSITQNLTFIAWHLRYLGSQMSQWAQQWRQAIIGTLRTAAKVEQSIVSIRIAMGGYSEATDKAIELSKEFARRGLLPLKDSMDIVSDIAITGLGFKQLRTFLKRSLEVAIKQKDTTDEQVDSLKNLTTALIRGGKVIKRDEVMTRIWDKTNTRLNKTLGVQLKQLNLHQRALALTRTLTENFTDTQGLTQVQSKTLAAQITKLKTSFQLLQLELSKAVKPLVYFGVKVMQFAVEVAEKLMDKYRKFIGVIVSVGSVLLQLGATFFSTMGIILSVVKIAIALRAALWTLLTPIGLISAAVSFATYKFLDYSGAFKAAKNAAKRMKKELNEVQEAQESLTDQTEKSTGVTNKKKIAHQRTVSDIKEQIEEEKSKGLWADQERIESLEKRLKREQEDYKLLRDEAAENNNDFSNYFNQMELDLKGLGKTTEDQTKSMTETWNKMIEDLKNGWYNFIDWIQNPNQWDEFLETVEEKARKAGEKIYPILEKIATKIKDVLTSPDFWEKVGNIIFNLGKFIVEVFKSAIKGLGEALTDAIMGKGVESVDALNEAQQRLINTLEKQGASQKKINEARRMSIRQQKDVQEEWRKTQQFLHPFGGEGGGWLLNPDVKPNLFLGGPGKGGYLNIGGKQFGGRVPGAPGEEVPIIAHGGERVVQRHEVGGNITININEPTVREDEDLQRIANEVSKVLGQKRKLAQLGA